MDPEQVKQRPLAVMLNNILEGCPQTGTSKASIIYEAPVEGRITRLMGLFENYGDMDKIGYIRSSRDYFVYCALEFDAIYAHFGQATPYVGELLNSDRVDNISGPLPGLTILRPIHFLRTTERKMPHNVYLDIKGLQKDIDKMKYSRTYHDAHKPKFAFAADGRSRTTAKEKLRKCCIRAERKKTSPTATARCRPGLNIMKKTENITATSTAAPILMKAPENSLPLAMLFSSTATVRCAMKMIIWPLAATVTTA